MAYKQHLMEDFTVNGADDECTLHKHRKGVAYWRLVKSIDIKKQQLSVYNLYIHPFIHSSGGWDADENLP